MKNGSYDTFKGSFYVNCDFYHGSNQVKPTNDAYSQYLELTASNVWPPEELLPGFRHCFEELCTLIIDIAAMVARACDRYAMAKIEGYEPGYLEQVVRLSTTTKARLLHYFPSQIDDQGDKSTSAEILDGSDEKGLDSWCTTHVYPSYPDPYFDKHQSLQIRFLRLGKIARSTRVVAALGKA